MIKLVIGGAYQGKRDYVERTFGIPRERMTDGAVCRPEDCLSAVCVYHFHTLIRRMLEEPGVADPLALAKEILERNPELIIITNEIGGGIIPLDKAERIWRERAGQVNCCLAAEAGLVVRVVCGLPQILKGSE